MENEILLPEIKIEDKILVIRGQQVMIDRDLAELYGVETKVLNQAVKRNIERFPERFMFQLTKDEMLLLESCSRSQIVTLNEKRGRGSNIKYLPYVFTEQGVAMLASVLKSDAAIQTSIMIMDAFVALRRFLQSNFQVFAEIDSIKRHQLESDKRIDELFYKMDRYKIEDRQGIFFQGQIFDAYAKFEAFIQSAEHEIILIDNYIDLSVLERLSKKQKDVKVTIDTDPKTKLSEQDIQKFNEQYPQLTLKHSTKVHDRFLIIDNKTLYHIGASLKDLGKKCFAFEVLDSAWIKEILKNL
ncbi:ORF6N domain-containing protein [bacterium]|nr:ORF6N domain-containing protein [bacterium]